jgi:hypothetical protein
MEHRFSQSSESHRLSRVFRLLSAPRLPFTSELHCQAANYSSCLCFLNIRSMKYHRSMPKDAPRLFIFHICLFLLSITETSCITNYPILIASTSASTYVPCTFLGRTARKSGLSCIRERTELNIAFKMLPYRILQNIIKCSY